MYSVSEVRTSPMLRPKAKGGFADGWAVSVMRDVVHLNGVLHVACETRPTRWLAYHNGLSCPCMQPKTRTVDPGLSVVYCTS